MQKTSIGEEKTGHGTWAIQKGIQTRQCTGQEKYHRAYSVNSSPEAASQETKQQELTVDPIPPP